MAHKFKVGQTVRLPGTRVRSPRFKNQFAYDQTGVIEALGWTKPRQVRRKVKGSGREVTNQYGLTYIDWDYEIIKVKDPVYLISGKWYGQGGDAGIKKL